VKRNLLIALRMTLLTLLVTGLLYPLAVTGVAQLAFREAATGSLVSAEGRTIGSRLVGQSFTSDRYFHSRPSAAGEDGYDAAASSASNLGPTSRDLVDGVSARVDEIVATEQGAKRGEIPVDLVTASGSGLDPDISPDAAALQVARVARVRGLAEAEVERLVAQSIKQRQFGLLGEPRVNVLELNLALDALSSR
jgi:K+-transporting ATPase ATPase C chain